MHAWPTFLKALVRDKLTAGMSNCVMVPFADGLPAGRSTLVQSASLLHHSSMYMWSKDTGHVLHPIILHTLMLL